MKIDALRRALINVGPGDTQSSKKQILLTPFLLLVFGCRNKGEEAEQGIVVIGVWSFKRSYSVIEAVIL